MQAKRQVRPLAASIAALLLGGFCGAAGASLTDISNTPLASSSSNLVKPNVSFVLDTSGSMAWTHAPDESQPMNDNIGYRSSHCNSIYYDPNIVYPPARHADGTTFPNASFTAAWTDGLAATGSVNLSTSFYAFDNTSSFGAGSDTATGPAYYYVYTGSQVPTGANYQNTGSTFYTECSYPLGNNTGPTATLKFSGSSTTSVSSIKVNGVEMMSGTSSSSSSSSTEASNVAAKITANGFSATASSGTITITGPNSAAGFPMVITKSGSMTLTPTAFAPFKRFTVTSTSGPGGTDERQNFANWFSYYRVRILMMKSGAGRAFVGIGQSYRVGFMTIYTTPSSSTTDPGYLKINDFDTTQKTTFFSKLYNQSPGGGTPLKQALSEAARNIAGKVGPDPIQYSCQQNFIILSTDGYWNSGTPNGVKLDGSTSVGNQDNALAPPMYDGGASGASNTLADVAAYYYNTDLKSTATGACNTGVSGADVCNDNVPITPGDSAPWQHITLFTLGLGTNGQLNYTNDYLDGGSADYNAIVGGSKNWPVPVGDTLTTIDDLWHAAVNGHGQYFSAKNPDLLVSGLQNALSGISAREAAGAAAATSNLEPVNGDNFIFFGSYETQKWDGELVAKTIDPVTGVLSTTSLWSAQAMLDAQVSPSTDTRTIFTFLGGAKVAFVPGTFTAAQKTAWFTPNAAPVLSQAAGWTASQLTNATADSMINYLRGQNGNEESGANPGANQLYRQRDHTLGDVVDGKPVYLKIEPFEYLENNYAAYQASVQSRQGVVYLAANDGMLHAINATTGSEMWAYVPSFVLPNLKSLADDTYATNHKYFVDGSPVIGDIWDGTKWRALLVGGLGAGGKGYYALDVTNPSNPIVMWEFTDTNMGFTYGNPVIGKLASGTWVVNFTSGYNNADGLGHLYVVNAATGSLIYNISTGVGNTLSPSGLGKISGWSDNGLQDNTILRIYGGDLLGNLWRFDINDIYPPSGKEATKLANFTVSGVPQPITTAPELGLVGSVPVVFVGTGRYIGASDISNTSQQSLYAIRDDLTGTGFGDVRAAGCLAQQTFTIVNANFRNTSNNPVNFSTNCGWYIDFNPGNSTPGERVTVDPVLENGVLIVASNIPESSVCTVGGSSFIYFFDFSSGAGLPITIGGQTASGLKVGSALDVGLSVSQTTDGRTQVRYVLSDTTTGSVGAPPPKGGVNTGRRVQWRELLN